MTRQFSAGGTVYKNQGATAHWLIIKPKPSSEFPKERYQLPKGLIGAGETIEEAAIREVREETGITAKIIQKVDDSKYIFSLKSEKIFKVVSWFLMEYVSGEPTADGQETEAVLWKQFKEAKKLLSYSSDKTILQKAANLLV